MMLLTTEGAKAGECFSPLYHFQNMTYMKSLGEINEIPSADRENSLKCRYSKYGIPLEHISRVFGDNLGIIMLISP